MPTLRELVEQLQTLDDDATIFVRRDWTPESPANIFALTDEGRVPEAPKQLGLSYFLEVSIAREVDSGMPEEATVDERCARLIQYAMYDA
jgi:hypothetical protein